MCDVQRQIRAILGLFNAGLVPIPPAAIRPRADASRNCRVEIACMFWPRLGWVRISTSSQLRPKAPGAVVRRVARQRGLISELIGPCLRLRRQHQCARSHGQWPRRRQYETKARVETAVSRRGRRREPRINAVVACRTCCAAPDRWRLVPETHVAHEGGTDRTATSQVEAARVDQRLPVPKRAEEENLLIFG